MDYCFCPDRQLSFKKVPIIFFRTKKEGGSGKQFIGGSAKVKNPITSMKTGVQRYFL